MPFIESFLENIVSWIENPVVSFMIRRKNGIEKFNTIKNHLYPIAKLNNYKLEFGDRITIVKEVREIFKIPNGNEAVMSLIIGYPKIKYKRGIRRKNKNINFIK